MVTIVNLPCNTFCHPDDDDVPHISLDPGADNLLVYELADCAIQIYSEIIINVNALFKTKKNIIHSMASHQNLQIRVAKHCSHWLELVPSTAPIGWNLLYKSS